MSNTNDLINAAFPKGALFPLPWFGGFVASSPVIPQLYWNVYSSEQRWKTICCDLKKLIEYANQQSMNINVNREDIDALESLFKKFQENGFNDYYREQIQNWIEDNLAKLWDIFAKQVTFGLTSDGYFCAYVPESWSDIQFDTGATYGTEQYGRLILRYNDVQDPIGTIDNTAPDYAELGA